MSTSTPLLPPPYTLVALDSVDSVLAEALRRGREGAEEGTVIWAREQSDARTPAGTRWHSPPSNLHCAVLLEPDYPNAVADQLAHVACVAAGAALAGELTPMVGLRYRWPTWILLNGLLCGHVSIGASGTARDPADRLAVALALDVGEHPENPEPERYVSVHASGSPDATVEGLLEAYSREFLRWINRWAEDGFGPVRERYVARLDGVGEPAHARVDGRRLEAPLAGVDERGAAIVETDGAQRTVTVATHFELWSGR